MAATARKFEMEDPVEARIARLESTTEHIQSDVAEIKKNLKSLDEKVDENYKCLDAKLDTLKEAFASLNVARAMDKVWALLTIAALLSVMARGFKWI